MSEIKTLKGKISCRQASEDTRVIIDNSFSIVVPKGMKFSTDQTEFEDNKIFALFSPVDPDSLLENSVDFEYGASSARLRIDPKKRSLSSLNATDKEVQKIMEAAFSDADTRKKLEQALLSGLSNVAESFVVKNDKNAIVVATTPMAIAFGNAAFAIMLPNGYTYSGQYLVRDDPEAVLDVASPAVYKKTIKKWLGTVEVVSPQKQKSAEQKQTAAEDKPAPLSKGEITYKKGHVFKLASLVIPVPDGMRYMAHTANSSVPNGRSVPASKMNYDFVCYTGKAIADPDQYKNARFGFSVISPQVISASECADGETELTQELAEGIAAKVMEATYQQVNKKPQEVVYDRKETNVLIAHSRLDKSTDKENYWESFLFVVVDSMNMICYRGTIFINAPSNRRVFDSVVKEFLQHISVLDGAEKSSTDVAALGTYARGGKMNAMKVAELYQKDVFWTNNEAIEQNKKHNRILEVEGVAGNVNRYDDIMDSLPVFCEEIKKVIEYVEVNEKLIVDKKAFHKELLAVTRGGTISGAIWFEFLAWHMLSIAPGEKSTYVVFVDRNLAIGIPDVYNYIGEFIRTLHLYNGVTDAFTISFAVGLSADVPNQLNCDAVSGAAKEIGSDEVMHFEGVGAEEKFTRERQAEKEAAEIRAKEEAEKKTKKEVTKSAELWEKATKIRSRYNCAANWISSSSNHIAVVKADGTVVAAGKNDYGQCDVSAWRDVVSVQCDHLGFGTVGVTSKGTVYYAGVNLDKQAQCQNWRGIKAAGFGDHCVIGLRYDGTVVATSSTNTGVGKGDASDVTTWSGIDQLRFGADTVAGITRDGKLLHVSRNCYQRCETSYSNGAENVEDAAIGEIGATLLLKKMGRFLSVVRH